MATSVPMIKAYKEDKIKLARVLYIYYPIWFKKNKIWTLINSGSKVNTITFAYTAQLGLKIWKTSIST